MEACERQLQVVNVNAASNTFSNVKQSIARIDRLVVTASAPLEGAIPVSGAKNSILKLMAATLLAEGEYLIHNVPRISDVGLMADLLHAVGCSVEWVKREPSSLRIVVPSEINSVAPYEIVEKFRASVVVLGPMLGRCGEAKVALPGGDDLGPRPVDMHLKGLMQMGAEIEIVHGNIEATVAGKARLQGAELTLEFPSVGATENLLMASVVAEGVTVIENAAQEPEVADLCRFLIAMGASIQGVGTATLRVEGAKHPQSLQAVSYTAIPDRIEAATYLAASGIAGGDITVLNARHDHMVLLLQKLTEMGMHIKITDEGIRSVTEGPLNAVDISTLPYPGIATDYKPFLVAMLSTSVGVGIVTENLFSARFRYVDELRRMGADIRTDAHHAVVRGVKRLSGAPVKAHDIRAGAALAVAALAADGVTTLIDAHHVVRGYEDIAGKLASVGADIYAQPA